MQLNSHNKISIIIPTYNRVDVLVETLNSVLGQTYKNWECIIVDDGSEDNISEVLIPYLKDSRFKFYNRPPEKKKGANSCRNYGFEMSSGEFIKWFDSDDIMLPDFLQKQCNYLEQNKNLDFCVCLSETFIEGTDKTYINKANRNASDNPISSYLFKNHFFLTAAPLWRKEFLRCNNLLFDEELSNSDESDFHFRVIILRPKYYYSDDILYKVRRGNMSITQDKKNLLPTLYSKVRFFKKVELEIKKIKIKDENLIYDYLLSRQLNLFYEIQKINKRSIIECCHDFSQLFFLLKKSRISIFHKIKILVGFLLVSFFGKGYQLIYFKVNCRELIEN
ncbi:glycosyltransferase family 2 protein [Flavobacterium sp. TR2]|uniref:glycosyltransferase family 2 protein n=1 Tax=Flavobacterium sp. TR2 TaxID=2977321 RepID=UPI0021B1157F|nr:glycosyltransferase family 2 protein [Flavobacterium sp. TR2]UWY28607.1 glycosyltransferase family 2 protein [Flavobacterium sp. TR2]